MHVAKLLSADDHRPNSSFESLMVEPRPSAHYATSFTVYI